MEIRLFLNDITFVHQRALPVIQYGERSFILPLLQSQVDINSLKIMNITEKIYLSSLDSENVLSLPSVQDDAYILCRVQNGEIPDTLDISYTTTGIQGYMIYRIYTDTERFESILRIVNNTPTDISGAEIEVITAQQVGNEGIYRLQSSMDTTTSSVGSIYIIDGEHTIPSGYSQSIPLIQDNIEIDTFYVIDAPNGQANAIYTLQWRVESDLPPGQLYVYRANQLESVSNIQLTGNNQIREVPLLRVPSVYAVGTVTQKSNDSSMNIQLKGTLFNTLEEEIEVYIRYNVGNGTLNIDADRYNEYAIFPFTLERESNQRYDIQFSVTY